MGNPKPYILPFPTALPTPTTDNIFQAI